MVIFLNIRALRSQLAGVQPPLPAKDIMSAWMPLWVPTIMGADMDANMDATPQDYFLVFSNASNIARQFRE
jgi:hypothetical protein